jgi:hypothetical protein
MLPVGGDAPPAVMPGLDGYKMDAANNVSGRTLILMPSAQITQKNA